MITEIVYLGRNNTIDMALMADGILPDLATITRITLGLDDAGETLIDSVDHPEVFDWTQTLSSAEASKMQGASAGDPKIVLVLGGLELNPGTYNATLTVYDPGHADGLVWGTFRLIVK